MSNPIRLASLSAAAALLLLASHGAGAVVLDFEDLGSPSCGLGTGPAQQSSGGFLFDAAPGGVIDACSTGSDFFFASNGSTYIAATAIIMTPAAAGTTFDMAAFDVAEYALVPLASTLVTVTGTLDAGGSVVATFTTDGVNDGGGGTVDDFEPFGGDLSGFLGLTSVTFSAGLPIGIDNLSLTVFTASVPAPDPALLLAAGLLLMAGAAVRRRPSASHTRR